jgi:uncharacterized membrane protein
MTYLILKFSHVLGANVILGTGSGIAFFMLVAHRTANVSFIARTATVVVIADMIFTASAVVAQPLTGYLLIRETGESLSSFWIVAALVLFALAVMFWVPVVCMQARLAIAADAAGEPLPESYRRIFSHLVGRSLEFAHDVKKRRIAVIGRRSGSGWKSDETRQGAIPNIGRHYGDLLASRMCILR